MMTTFMTVHEFPDHQLEENWRDCLKRVRFPAHYNSPEYFLSPLWEGKRPFAVLAFQDSRVVGILTGIHDGENLNCGLQSRPQVCMDETLEPVVIEESLAMGLRKEENGESLVNVYSWAPLEGFGRLGFHHREFEGDVVLDLSLGADVLFKQFHESHRRNIRNAIRNGIEVATTENREDFLEYYEVCLRWHQTKRKKIVWKIQPLENFLKGRALTGNSCLFVARHKGKIIAGIVVRFFRGGLLEFASNSSLDEFIHLRPNDLLQWRAIEWACREGFKKYSLGGAHRFLRHFGGTLVPIHRYRIDRSWLRRHDLCEGAGHLAREGLRQMPPPIQKTVRRILGRGT
jgi:hypothetical protein